MSLLRTKNRTFVGVVSLVLILSLCLSACSSSFKTQFTQASKGTSTTELTMNSAGSGSRHILLSLNKGIIDSKFAGGKEEFDAFLEDRHPKELALTISDYDYVFTLDFNSVTDYTKKVESITASPVNITFSASNNVFSEGFRISESFTSEDLMKWFYQDTYDESILEQDETMWDLTDSVFSYEGNMYPCGSRIEFSQMTYTPVDKVSMATSVHDSTYFNRKISVAIPTQSINAIGETEIRQYMQTLTPENANVEWKDTVTGKSFTVDFTANSVEELSKKTNTFMGNSLGSITYSGGDDTIFNSSSKINEDINLSSFPSNAQGRTFFEYNYTFDTDANYNKAYLISDGTKVDLSSRIVNGVLSVADDFDTFKINLESSKRYDIDNVNYSLEQDGSEYFTRVLEIDFNDSNGQRGAEITQNYVNDLGIAALSAVATDSVCTITISGTLQQVNSATAKLISNQSRLSLNDTNSFSLYNYTTIDETLDLASFLKKLGYTGEYNYLFRATDDIININGQSDSGDYFVGERNLADSKTVMLTADSKDKTAINIVSRRVNVVFVVAIIALILLLIGVIAVVIMIIVSKIREKDEEANKNINSNNGAYNSYSTPVQPKQTEIPLTEKKETQFIKTGELCKKCGTPIYEGMSFCIKCGVPLNKEENEDWIKPIEGVFCPNCKAQIYEGMNFCVRCGDRLDNKKSSDEK